MRNRAYFGLLILAFRE